MTLTRALSSAYSGLSTSSFRADVAAENIANATTPGYVRREVITTENRVGSTGSGVTISGIERHQDMGLTRLRRESDASYGRANILSSAYTQIDRELGVPGEGYGLFSSFETLEKNLRELANTPESAALQNSVYASSQELVRNFNALANMSNTMRTTADANISRSVETVNEALHRIDQLNGDLAGLSASSGDSAALEDERQRLIDSIAEIVPIRDIPRDGNQIDIITENGVFLLSGHVNELEFTPSGGVPNTARYGVPPSTLSGLTVNGQDLTPGTGGNFSLGAGTLAGHFAVRDSVTTQFNDQLDSLAADLISRFSDDGLDSTKAPGAPGIFTDAGNAVDPLNISGAASRIRLNAAIDPTQGGDITRLRDGIGATSQGPTGNADLINAYVDALNNQNTAPSQSGLSGNFTSIELIAGFSSLVGENRVRHDALTASAASRNNLLFDAEIQKSAVDTDKEMQSLLLIEQSYAANARVIQTISDMIDRLMQI